jgi:RHS repeat-associated protein
MPRGTASYDPWGTPQGSSLAPFGFTGELQDAAGLTYLRARWYNTLNGMLTSRDPFTGFSEKPYSLHSYQYGYSNPLLYTDPSGRIAIFFNGGFGDPDSNSPVQKMAETLIRRGVLKGEDTKVLSANQTGVSKIFLEGLIEQARIDCEDPPVIIVGYSRGGATAQLLAHSPYIKELVGTIDLVVTIAPVPAFHLPSLSTQKAPIVQRHINFTSEQLNAAWSDNWPDWPAPIDGFPEINIDGADANIFVHKTSHFSVVDEQTRLYTDLSTVLSGV